MMQPEQFSFQADLEGIASRTFIPWEALRDSTILVTGATGLIGYTLVCGLLFANRQKKLGLHVLALVRDEARARERFEAELAGARDLTFVTGTVERLPQINSTVDYIIHGASRTASKGFVKEPVETIRTALEGTVNLLEMAKSKCAKSFAYLSSMEVYGYPPKGHRVTENEIGAMSPLELRNSYPISKQQCESLCCAYASEYGVPTKIVRLAQTFGPGSQRDDSRISAELLRCVRERRDIVLKTKGETERSYLYTADAATAILTILLKGETGQAYNAADESTYCSIAQMAQKMAQSAGIKVRYDLQSLQANGYPQAVYMDLDTARLRALGWAPIQMQ